MTTTDTSVRLAGRSTRAVLEDHLQLRRERSLEADLERNYAADVACLSLTGVRHGHDGVRAMAAELRDAIGEHGEYRYRRLLVEGEVGMLVWDAWDADSVICEGVDSYVVRGGKLVAQTVHYFVHHR